MIRKLSLSFGLCVALAANAPAAEKLTVAGTGSNQILLRALAAGFEKKNPGVEVDVPDSIGSGGGIKAAGEGKADFGRVGRKLKDKEKSYGLEYLPFAKTPVVFMAHPGIPVKGLTAAQTVEIYSGKVKNWKEVGGPDARLRVVTRPEGEASLVTLRDDVPGWKGLTMLTEAKVTDSEPQSAAVVAGAEGAIGFTTYEIARDAKLTVFDLDGVKPTDKKYPALMESALVFKPDRLKGAAKAFVDFVFSKEGGEIIRKLGSQPLPR